MQPVIQVIGRDINLYGTVALRLNQGLRKRLYIFFVADPGSAGVTFFRSFLDKQKRTRASFYKTKQANNGAISILPIKYVWQCRPAMAGFRHRQNLSYYHNIGIYGPFQ